MKKINKKNENVVRLILVASMFLFAGNNVYAANQMASDSYSFTVIADNTAPAIAKLNPQSGTQNVSRSSNIKFLITDDLSGLDSSSIDLIVDSDAVIINGVVQTYVDSNAQVQTYAAQIIEKSAKEFVVVYDPAEYFFYKQSVAVKVTCADVLSNVLSNYSYTFETQNFVSGNIKSFSRKNTISATGVYALTSEEAQDNARLSVSADGKNVYLVWEECSLTGSWDVYFSKSTDFGNNFSTAIKVNQEDSQIEHCYPAIAVDDSENVYVSWQQRSTGADWDIYIASLKNGASEFTDSFLVCNDANFNDQTHPAFAVGQSLTSDGNELTVEPSSIYICWIETAGTVSTVQYTRTTADYSDAWYNFVPITIRVDDERLQQSCYDPKIEINANGDIFVAWRALNANNTSSIYFDYAQSSVIDAGEDFGVDIIVSDSTANGKGPALKVSESGNDVFILWKELFQSEANLNFYDYQYSIAGSTYELNTASIVNASPFTAATLFEYDLQVDDKKNAVVVWSGTISGDPVITIAGATNINAYQFKEYKQFTTSGQQDKPALAIDNSGAHFYIGWTDNSSGADEVYFCRNTFIVTDDINTQAIENNIGANVSVTQGSLAGTSVNVSDNSLDFPLQMTIAKVIAPPAAQADLITIGEVIDFGPGGTVFDKSVTIELPYTDALLNGLQIAGEAALNIYYYNLATLRWEIVNGAVVDTMLNKVSVATDHFSMYVIGALVSSPGADEGVDSGADEGTGSSSAAVPSVGVSAGGGGGGGGGCFIATAAFGTKMAKEVRILNEFRDRYLLTNKLGTKFVKFYYKNSPPIANYIAKNEVLKAVIRIGLKPLVQFGKMMCR
ncbi:MAG: hypothetical protein HY810_06010 [Candidatus Omnitrophica bacterium]|nr:hypothetical protein [Candidatus Omnitrophota bacterium]